MWLWPCVRVCAFATTPPRTSFPIFSSFFSIAYAQPKVHTRHCGGNSANKIWLFALIVVCYFDVCGVHFIRISHCIQIDIIAAANVYLFICVQPNADRERGQRKRAKHNRISIECMCVFCVWWLWKYHKCEMRRASDSYRLTRGLLFVSISAARMRPNGFFPMNNDGFLGDEMDARMDREIVIVKSTRCAAIQPRRRRHNPTQFKLLIYFVTILELQLQCNCDFHHDDDDDERKSSWLSTLFATAMAQMLSFFLRRPRGKMCFAPYRAICKGGHSMANLFTRNLFA